MYQTTARRTTLGARVAALLVLVSSPLAVSSASAHTGRAEMSTRKATSSGRSIAGTVVDSAGHRLAGLPIELTAVTSPRGPLYGKTVFRTTTRSDGSFAIAEDPSMLGALAFSATAAFPWHGGRWPRELVLTGGDAQHLAFKTVLRHTVDRFTGLPGNFGSEFKITDLAGCTDLSGSNPAYPATDPSTTSITLTFAPDGPLVDGTTGRATKGTITNTSLCGYGGLYVELPAGAWAVSGVTNTGRRLAFTRTGGRRFQTQYVAFWAAPYDGTALVNLDVRFA